MQDSKLVITNRAHKTSKIIYTFHQPYYATGLLRKKIIQKCKKIWQNRHFCIPDVKFKNTPKSFLIENVLSHLTEEFSWNTNLYRLVAGKNDIETGHSINCRITCNASRWTFIFCVVFINMRLWHHDFFFSYVI